MQNICFTHQLGADVDAIADALQPDRLFVLTDETTHALCLPRLAAESRRAADATVISIGATDTHKTLESLAHVWTRLCEGGATRHSLLLNLGGGMVTDLGGFAAATFNFGYYDILLWSNIDSPTHTQVVLINENDIDEVTATTTATRGMLSEPLAEQVTGLLSIRVTWMVLFSY